ncbi:MAG: Inositol-monophosphatase [Pedosphaera sp.]|nr:Inositol-monophosphatase [Pedosphaera sp.]
MTLSEQKKALACAVQAARAAGKLMRQNLFAVKKINVSSAHDIKLELDVRCQKLIETVLYRKFPRVALLGEEGVAGDPNSAERWVVDPIDGTVNFTYGIPHACVSIALQVQNPGNPRQKTSALDYETVVGVVYDPFCDELWTAIRGQPARLNGKIIRVSERKTLGEAIVSIGFAKSPANLKRTLPYFNKLVGRVRKVRMMGAAALALTYVASGRFDAYIERGIRLWDIAAGGLIVESAGGEFWREPVAGEDAYRLLASNGRLRKKLQSLG